MGACVWAYVRIETWNDIGAREGMGWYCIFLYTFFTGYIWIACDGMTLHVIALVGM